MKIAITSGKGGTGKTTVSTGLFHVLSKTMNLPVQLLDCDVEEPNCHIFIKAAEKAKYPVSLSIPVINRDACTFCGKCQEACHFNAIVMLPPAKYIEVSPDLCHGCGICTYVCPAGAVREQHLEIGKVIHFDAFATHGFLEGRMKVGYASQTRVVRETIRHGNHEGILIYDASPGTSCPVVATVSKADFVVMVTEPTPFGLYDLKLMTETVKQVGKAHGVIINKSGLPYKPLYDYIRHNNIPVLGEIPFRKELAEAYSKGIIIADVSDDIHKIFSGIIECIMHEETL